MNFTVETNRIYAADADGRIVAEITFPAVGAATVRIERTFVDESLRGQGVAGQLMEAVVQTLRATGRRAEPVCSYAVRWMEQHPDSADVRA